MLISLEDGAQVALIVMTPEALLPTVKMDAWSYLSIVGEWRIGIGPRHSHDSCP
jgi:hypothetical protein